MSNYIPETLPKGTTIEQWQRYAEDMERHEAHYKAKEPMPFNFENTDAYKSAYSRWQMDYSCFEPNKPGYYRANND